MIRSKFFVSGLLTALLLAGIPNLCADESQPTFPVTLEVDFGPQGEDSILMELKATGEDTPESLLKKACQVKNDAICCDPREVASVNNVATSPGANVWWVVFLNGSRDVNPFGTTLKPGDRVAWKYMFEDVTEKVEAWQQGAGARP
ncbi:MAG: hypothetical protein HYY14_00600 [Candidatus Omnitrophica bacterium]|nr:hypothetical protein [Candidatus Omnitrophota bacterium]